MVRVFFFICIFVALVSCHKEDVNEVPEYVITDKDISLDSLKTKGLPLLVIETDGHEEPSCDIIEHPEGCDGISITNVTKVPGRLTIYRGG